MSDQKIQEFRERAERGIAPTDPDRLLQRGRALRRRRRLAPVVALAACAAIGIGIATIASDDDGGASNEIQPANPPAMEPKVLVSSDLLVPPGDYVLDHDSDDRSDATVELVGEGWRAWDGGAHLDNLEGTVSWGLNEYRDTIIDQCHEDRHATSQSDALVQLTRIPGTVTKQPRPASALGLEGTYLQLRIPMVPECRTGTPTGANLMAMWEGPQDPTVTADVWLLGDGDGMLLLTKAVRGNPPRASLDALEKTVETIRLTPNS